MRDLSDIRNDYLKGTLKESDLLPHPVLLFNEWLQLAIKEDCPEPTAMHLSTVDEDGNADGRIVLLKSTEDRKFIFFSNYDSNKGQQLLSHPNASLTFWWQKMERQVRIKGYIEKTSKEISDKYFQSRPKESQLAAIVSPQSKSLKNREMLEEALQKIKNEVQDGPVQRPNNWGGYQLTPSQIEFWQGRASRLHDRFLYTHDGSSWKIERLAP